MLLYRGLAGSQLYGTATPESDTDYVEVYRPSVEDIFGLGDKWKGFAQTLGDEDVSRFGVNQFMKLVGKGNPNVLETLFCTPDKIQYINPNFRTLISGEDQTMSGLAALLHKKSVVKAHLGFALQQSKKMLPAKAKWAGPRREALFKKYGYDVKYAAHAVRLTHQCLDLLERGFVEYPYKQSVIVLLTMIKEGKMELKWVRDVFARGLERVQAMEQTDCAIDDDDKTDEINRRLISFYKNTGYADVLLSRK
jgi:predicted nucleotidyltransferase